MIDNETKRMLLDSFVVVHFVGTVARFCTKVEKYLVFSNFKLNTSRDLSYPSVQLRDRLHGGGLFCIVEAHLIAKHQPNLNKQVKVFTLSLFPMGIT